MWLLMLILTQAPVWRDVSVKSLDGGTEVGLLADLSATQVVLEVDGKRRTIGVRDVASIAVTAPAARSDSGVMAVLLTDGSRLLATRYAAKGGTATVQVGERRITLDTDSVRAVRFGRPSKALDTQWNEILGGALSSDVVVLRRPDDSLDQLEGVFHDVSDETVEFEFDNEVIPVKRTKLEGIIYFHAAGAKWPEPACSIYETGGTVWKAKDMSLDGDGLKLISVAGVTQRLPRALVGRLDFTSGNMDYLSDLEFDLLECTPYIATRVSPQRILQLYRPRRNESFEGSGLWLGAGNKVKRYEKGLAIHSRSVLAYRLAGQYRKLTAIAGIDSRVRGQGNVELIVLGDGKELFRKTISGQDAPLPLDLDIAGVQRLKIVVDFGQTLDVADHLNLCNARVIK